MNSMDTKCDGAKMRRALYKIMWDRVEAGRMTPRPCPALSDKEVTWELCAILGSTGTRRLSEWIGSFLAILVCVGVPAMILISMALALLALLARCVAGF